MLYNNILNEYYNNLNESIIISEPDILYNKDKFDSGEINLCFITGLSGSGKSTLSEKSSKDIDKFELDDLQWSWRFSDENIKNYGLLAYNFFNGVGKKYRIPYRIEKNGKMVGLNYDDVEKWFIDNGFIKNNKNTFYEESTKSFVDFSIKFAKSHKKTKFMVNGIQLFLWIDPSVCKDNAVYIKGTSALISTIRSVKRDSIGKLSDDADMFIRRMKDILFKNGFEEKINKWRNYYKKLNNSK